MKFHPAYRGKTRRRWLKVGDDEHAGNNARKRRTLVVVSRYVPHQSIREMSRRRR